MPIYEFYCSACHMVFNFLSPTVNTSKRPACPRCGKARLKRRASSFAISKGRGEKGEGGDLPDIDEDRLERAMMALAREAEGMSEDDPRQMARLVRTLYESTGLRLTGEMTEAIRRMEAGEDPEQIEQDLGDVLDHEEVLLPGGEKGLRALRKRLLPPKVDDTLYEL
jgi:putative FmdB family regulatory protein